MTTRSHFDYAMPYDIMVGAWTGHSILYDHHGNYLKTGPSLVSIYWKERGKILRYFQEDLGSLDDLVLEHEHKTALEDTIVTRAFDLEVNAKACRSATPGIQVEGVESTPGTYLFHLTFPGGNYYNNQYFENPNERRIIGPYVYNGNPDIAAVVAQTFARISYDIPTEFMEMEKAHLARES